MSQNSTPRLAGKVALVTGAAKGIGASIAEHLADEGASVVVNYSSSKADADRVVAGIAAKGGKAVAIQASVANHADITRLFAETKKQFGRLDILVNNAGIYEFGTLDKITEDHFRKQFDINVLGLLFASQEAAQLFGPEGGSIVNIGSIVSNTTPPATAVYSATKASVDAITHVLAKELGPRKIRVNAVNPGMVETPGWRAAGLEGSAFHKELEATAPLRRIGKPEDIAPTVVFLASPDSAWTTGETLIVSGGIR